MRIEDLKNWTVDQLKNEVVRLSDECEKKQHEILDKNEAVISPFTYNNCVPVKLDSTIEKIEWENSHNFASLKGEKVRFKFYLKKGELYSFWVSPTEIGASNGYNAAGGPGFSGGIDHEGISAYKHAKPYYISESLI